jgi:hypothetical protein
MRISVYIVLFFVFFNAGAVMLDETRTEEALGISAETGNPDELQQAQSSAQKVSASNSDTGTLFTFYTTLSSVFNSIVNILPAASMLVNVGTPQWFVNFVFAGAPIIVGIDILSVARGFNL